MLKWAGCVSDSLDVVTSRSLTSATISQLKTFTLAMRPPQGSLSDAEIWEMARNNGFMPPPQPWTFVDGGVKFGCDLYHVDKATLYELALLEVHSQYWETTSPDRVSPEISPRASISCGTLFSNNKFYIDLSHSTLSQAMVSASHFHEAA